MSEFRKIDDTLDNRGTRLYKSWWNFNRFSLPLKFIEKIYNYNITLNEAIEKQAELKELINKLNNVYNQKNPKKVKEKNKVLESARKLSDARDETIDLFEKETFPYKGKEEKKRKRRIRRKQFLWIKKY